MPHLHKLSKEPSLGTRDERLKERRRRQAIVQASEGDDEKLASEIRIFQFRDIQPKAASEIDDLGCAPKLSGTPTNASRMTVYRRVGGVIAPTH